MALEIYNDENNLSELFDKLINNNQEDRNIYKQFIKIDPKNDVLNIKFQSGPRKENKVNGVQIDSLIVIMSHVLKCLNQNFYCEENLKVISHLEECLKLLNERTINRIKSNVEGRSL